jgi:hypothetical protein
MKWLAILIVIVGAAALVVKSNFPTYTYRYRLQLSLAVDGKIHTGSSVIEVSNAVIPSWARGERS